jgi:hypothetical protein
MIQKTTWMLFLIIGISVLANSCRKRIDSIKYITYIYKNGTDYDLVMELYNRDGVNFKNFPITPNAMVETGTTVEEVPVPFRFYNPANYGDSVVIRFSNTRCLSYKRLSNGFGAKIFDYRKYDNYSPELEKNSKYTLYYTITEDDYNTSVECK